MASVVHPVSPALTLRYDLLGRLTNLVDGIGQTRYGYANNRFASKSLPRSPMAWSPGASRKGLGRQAVPGPKTP